MIDRNSTWPSRSKGRETRAKYWATKIANSPAVSGLVADFQYAAMWYQIAETRNQRRLGLSASLHPKGMGKYGCDIFSRHISSSHHKLRATIHQKPITKCSPPLSSSVLSLSPPGLVRPSGRAWGELLFHIWPPHLTPAVWWTRSPPESLSVGAELFHENKFSSDYNGSQQCNGTSHSI